MADVTWTQEQLAAITARNPGILVSAGAGSGKTAVLTERVVQRIFDPVDPVDADRMLIVTFTRAAAEEMRERIAVKLRAVQREHPEDSSVARQLILLEKADTVLQSDMLFKPGLFLVALLFCLLLNLLSAGIPALRIARQQIAASLKGEESEEM